MGTVAGANFAQILCCASEKVPAHTRGCVAATCPWNTSRQLFHKCANSAIWFLLHFLAIQPYNMSRQCVVNAILSPLHLAAACSYNMSPRVGPPQFRGIWISQVSREKESRIWISDFARGNSLHYLKETKMEAIWSFSLHCLQPISLKFSNVKKGVNFLLDFCWKEFIVFTGFNYCRSLEIFEILEN